MFKFRSGGQGTPSQAQPLTIEAVRRRARHRLIGASVLVLAAVIGFPVLFDSQPRPVAVDLPVDIPAKNTAKPLVSSKAEAASVRMEGLDSQEEVVASAKSASVPAAAAVSKPAADAKAEAKEHKPESKPEPKVKVAEKAPEKSAEKSSDKSEKADDKSNLRIVVQVGAFADTDRAREARLKLEHAGLKTYTHVADTPDGKRTRVRVGPFATRAEADKAAAKIKTLGLPAAILTL